MNKNQTCENCRYWAQYMANATGGQCRRRSPQVQNPQGDWTWPETAAEEFCGEFEDRRLAAMSPEFDLRNRESPPEADVQFEYMPPDDPRCVERGFRMGGFLIQNHPYCRYFPLAESYAELELFRVLLEQKGVSCI